MMCLKFVLFVPFIIAGIFNCFICFTATAVIGGASGLNLTLNLSGPATTGHGLNAAVSVQLIEQIKNMLRATGYSEQATSQISSAMSTLAR